MLQPPPDHRRPLHTPHAQRCRRVCRAHHSSLAGATYLSRGILWDQPDLYYLYLTFERPQLEDGDALHAAKEPRNIAQKLAESDRQIIVFWGSQSGTAEGFANRLARDIAWRDDLFAAFRRNLGITETDPQYIPTLTEDESLGPNRPALRRA